MYMVNLVTMVLMTSFVIGVLIIQLVVYLEGSFNISFESILLLIPLAFILWLNIYVITLEDHDEAKFFKN